MKSLDLFLQLQIANISPESASYNQDQLATADAEYRIRLMLRGTMCHYVALRNDAIWHVPPATLMTAPYLINYRRI